MKKNGFTLIELLATLTILGTILIIVFSIFNSGIKQGESTKKDVFLQQEANIVATSLRKAYLSQTQYTLKVTNNQIILNDTIKDTIVSNKYQYQLFIDDNLTMNTLYSFGNTSVRVKITFTNGSSTYTLRTTLSRGV